MSQSSSQPGPVFSTCAVHLSLTPQFILRRDPPCCHLNDEGIAKIDRFCHRIYKVPITWLCSYSALKRYGEQLKGFIHEYGDEVAIYESGIATLYATDNRPGEFQPWVEECGLSRPDEGFQSKEAEAIGAKAFHDMGYEEQKIALTYLKKAYEEFLDAPVRTLATPATNHHTIRVMSEIGLDITWGYCWNYFCEGMNHKGSLFYPFYVSHLNHSVPEQEAEKNKVLALHWGTFSHLVYNHVEIHSRLGGPGFCSNALELANRSEGLDKFDLHRKLIEEWAEWAAWNSFVHLPLQLEGCWLSEDEISADLYDQFPTFNSANTEVFYTQIETALRVGAKPVTFSQFADWHKANIRDTAEVVGYCEDPLPEVRNRGKDQAYVPQVLYGSKGKQYCFDKSRGFNYVRKYVYTPIVGEEDIVDEYSFADEPRVYLKIKRGLNVMAGIAITPEKTVYELASFDLTAYHDDPDYAAILWQANIPPYIKDSDIETGGALTGFRTVREKNIALLFANLKKGDNSIIFRSDLPKEHIKIVSSEKVGKRYEIWFENDAEEVFLHTLDAKTLPGLKVGGFWWDGRYSRTIYRFGWGHYDRETGNLHLRAFYPVSLKLNHGLTRMSLELL